MRHAQLLCASLAAALVVACGADEPPAASPPQPIMTYGAVNDAMANAACRRAQRCGDVGEGEDFESAEACLVDYSDDASEAVDSNDCDRPVLREQLEGCLAVIDATACDDDVDIEEIKACRAEVLCPAAET
jgi:hypothetical protein